MPQIHPDGPSFPLVAAAYTPLTPDGEINLAAVDSHAEMLVGQGVAGVFVNGTTGEGTLLTGAERQALAQRWVDVVGGQLDVLIHVGHASVREAAELARHAQRIGADGIAAIPPFFHRPQTVQDLVEVSRQIAAGAPGLPFLYYHMPVMTGVTVPMAAYLSAAGEAVPTFAGIKYTSEDLREFSHCLELAGGKYQMLFGRDEILLAGLAMGARGAVGSSYCFAAGPFTEIAAAYARGDLATAQATQADARRLIDIGLGYGGHPAFKTMLRWAGVDCGPCRSPLRTLEPEAERRMRAEVEDAGLAGLIANGAGPHG